MSNSLNQINHVVVLMLENRSFDHMLGYLFNKNIQTFFNVDLADANKKIFASNDANYINDIEDPGHTIEDTNQQLYGQRNYQPGTVPTNLGFIKNYSEQALTKPGTANNIMKCFAPSKIPALTTLASEFCVCTNWFSSVPGPTWPNRFFVHCATSGGYVDNTFRSYPMDPIYKRLDEKNIHWNIYFHDFPQSLAINYLRADVMKDKYRTFHKFKADAAAGNLPSYSFIEPAYFNFLNLKANDQHPPHDVEAGDNLIADIYNTLKNSPLWESTLLVIIYDENGGIYDSLPPPQTTVNPDGNNASNFTFDRLGFRVPAVLVSPYISKGVIDTTIYDHTSLLATVEKRFGLKALTKRDAAAATFEQNLSLLVPRDKSSIPGDIPISKPPLFSDVFEFAKSGFSAIETILGIKHKTASRAVPQQSQLDLIELAKHINPVESRIFRFLNEAPLITTEHEGALFVLRAMSRYLKL